VADLLRRGLSAARFLTPLVVTPDYLLLLLLFSTGLAGFKKPTHADCVQRTVYGGNRGAVKEALKNGDALLYEHTSIREKNIGVVIDQDSEQHKGG